MSQTPLVDCGPWTMLKFLPQMTPAGQNKLLKFIVCLFLAAITAIAFAGVAHNGFFTLDDSDYVVANPAVQHGFTWATIKWAFSTVHSSNWHPVTWLSHTLDCQLFGLNPAGPHLMNLAFHIANVILLFLLMDSLTAMLWPSAFVALLFAIHPMHVESVAWISERKDVLSAFFFQLTLLAYTRYANGRPSPQGGASVPASRSWPLYLLTLFLFALGLMAKPMLVTLPLILLLLDYWPLKRFNLPSSIFHPRFHLPSDLRSLLIEKIPFFLLAALSCWVTYLAQASAGAVKPNYTFSFGQRMAHSVFSFAWYVLKCFWPANLSTYYSLRTHQGSDLDVLFASLLLLGITAYALASVRKCPAIFVGWFWFLIMLLPVIGVVRVGGQAFADRYTYLPYIGLFIAIAWGIPKLIGQASSLSPGPRNVALCFVAILIAAACFWRTFVEVQYWKDNLTLFQRALVSDPKNETAWTLLGAEYSYRENYDKAIDCITHATTLDPQFNTAWDYLGKLHAIKGDYNSAQTAFQNALQYTWFDGDRMKIYNDFGDAFSHPGHFDQAIAEFDNSLAISPDQPEVQVRLGNCYLQTQSPELAAAAFQSALDLQPDNSDAHLGLATIRQGQNLDSEALVQYRLALASNPNSPMVLNNLAWLLATDSDPVLRNGSEAVSLAQRACEKTHYQKAFLIGTLAAAYAEAGRFDDAIAAAQKAHDVALAGGDKDLAARNAQLLQLYQSHQAFHQP